MVSQEAFRLWCVILAGMLVSSFSPLPGQVVIHEELRISPAAPSSLQQGTLTVNFSYEGSLRQFDTRTNPPQPVHSFMTIDHRYCGIRPEYNTVFLDAGSGTWSGPASGGSWRIAFQLHPLGTGTATLDVLLDGSLIRHWVWNESCTGDWCESLPYFDFFFFTDVSIVATPSSIRADGSCSISLRPLYQNCGAHPYLLSDSLTVRIGDGAGYGDLLDASGAPVENLKVLTSEQSPAVVRFKANCVQPPPEGDSVRVGVTVRDAAASCAFGILTAPPTARLLLDAPRSLSTGNAAALVAVALDSSGAEVTCVPDSLVTLTIDSACYSNVIRAGGDTVHFPLEIPYAELRSGAVRLVTGDAIPDSIMKVFVRASFPENISAVDSVYIVPPPDCVELTLCPSRVSPGDTTAIVLMDHKGNGKVVPFPPWQRFSAGLYDYADDVFGSFIDPVTQRPASSLDCVFQGFRYVAAADTVPPAGHSIRFFVMPKDPSWCESEMIAQAGNELSSTASQGRERKPSGPNRPADPRRPDADACVNEALRIVSHDMLLGETKYYQARICPTTGTLLIDELTSPSLSGGIAEDVWGDAPIEASVGMAEHLPSAHRPAVYWEKEKPIPGGSGNLPRGLIRLVGRYWTADSAYWVKLTARYGGQIASTAIEIIKPARLLTEGVAPSYRRSRDVFDREYDVDELCIRYGGQYGIPPQMIKGQIATESWKVNYVGDDGGEYAGFAPSYRYEPYVTQLDITEDQWGDNPFFVRATAMGTGDCVPGIGLVDCQPVHQHVYVTDYPTEPKTVWDMIWDCSQVENDIPDDAHRLYGIRKLDNTMNFYPYTEIQSWYNRILDGFQENIDPVYTFEQAAESSRIYMRMFLRDYWHGGAKNMIAQTRIASSYGLLQMTYPTALRRGYEPLARPENLNLPDGNLWFSTFVQMKLLISHFSLSSHNWAPGLEESLKQSIYVPWDPGKSNYADCVVVSSLRFMPGR